MQGNSDIKVSLATLTKYFMSVCYDTGSATESGTFLSRNAIISFNTYWDKIRAVH